MLIRHADIRDVPEVKRITDYFRVSRESEAETGFVEFPERTEADYLRRVMGNQFFYVAGNGSPVSGFLAAYDEDFMRRLQSTDPISKRILEKPCHFVYGDQIAVLPEARGQGRPLLERLFRDMRLQSYRRFFGAISHSPIRNIPIIKIMEELGAEQIEEINVNGLVFGIYQIDL